MNKPLIDDVRWAVDGVDADAANITIPSSGQQDTGYVHNAVPTSGVFNRLLNKIYRWLQFLNLYFGTQTLTIPIFPQRLNTTGTPGTAKITITPGTNSLQVGIPLPVGRRIKAVRAWIVDDSVAPTKLCIVFASQAAGVISVLSTSAASTGSGAFQKIESTGLAVTLLATTQYWLYVTQFINTAPCDVYTVEVDYDVPIL